MPLVDVVPNDFTILGNSFGNLVSLSGSKSASRLFEHSLLCRNDNPLTFDFWKQKKLQEALSEARNVWKRSNISWLMDKRSSFCLSDKFLGTIFAQIFLIHNVNQNAMDRIFTHFYLICYHPDY